VRKDFLRVPIGDWKKSALHGGDPLYTLNEFAASKGLKNGKSLTGRFVWHQLPAPVQVDRAAWAGKGRRSSGTRYRLSELQAWWAETEKKKAEGTK